LAKALLARLLTQQGALHEAKDAFDSIREPWLQIHPQVIIERDRLLRRIGKSTLQERKQWLARVDALPDEWIIERKVQLLLDEGQPGEAKRLLLSTPFQKVHQTYSRTNLWKQICDQLHLSFYPIPQSLGEDRLARFGAYREFEESYQ
jgi:hypothetical protein